jgi:hypothetical protein
MTELDRLPPDQRAVLSLVLDRGKSYAEVAAMLSIPETAVRARAHTALDALARAGKTAPSAASAPSPHPEATHTAPSAPPPRRRATTAGRQLPSSRVGGALLLGAIAVAAIVAAIVLGSGGKGSSGAGTNTTSASPPRTSTAPASGTAKINNRFALSAVEPESRAAGEAYVLSDGSRHAFYVAARNLPASTSHGFFYAVWLYNSPSSSAPLGRAPAVGSNGRLEGGGPLPSNASDYAKLILTRETSTHATRPGPIVLSGSFSLG